MMIDFKPDYAAMTTKSLRLFVSTYTRSIREFNGKLRRFGHWELASEWADERDKCVLKLLDVLYELEKRGYE